MNKTPTIIALLLPIFTFTAVNTFAYSGGNGTEASPYQIASAADLMQLAGTTTDYEKHFILTANINMTGQGDNPDGSFSTAVIAPDMDNTSTTFEGTEFEGSFDGNGYTISDLTINTNGIINHYLGLFGMVYFGGEIKNLNLDNVTVLGVDTSVTIGGGVDESEYVGGVCGRNYYADIINCNVSGSVIGGKHVGGVCGYNFENITDCSVSCSVRGSQKVGGICGTNYYYGSISRCGVTGDVDADVYYAGGICGYNDNGNINSCYITSDVTGQANELGALCGINFYGTISNSYATGSISERIWGISPTCETNYGNISKCYSTQVAICEKNWGSISDCYWDKDISLIDSASGGFPVSTSDMMNAATFKGWNDGTWRINQGSSYPHLVWEARPGTVISTDYPPATYSGNGTSIPFQLSQPADLVSLSQRSCDWDKDIVVTANIDMGLVTNYFPIANFTGSLDGQGHIISNLTIDSNVTKNLFEIALIGYLGTGGNVRNLGMTNVTLTGQELIGGLCGMNRGGTIDTCYVTGSVTNTILANIAGGLCGYNYSEIVDCRAEVDISGGDHIGGLCGWNSIGSINESYATGAITGNWMVGGLCGSNAGTVQNCYARGNVTQSGMWPSHTGGLCGNNGKIIENCYSTGSVNGNEGDIGGFCGRNNGSYAFIENCFWNIENQTGSTTEGVGANASGGTVTNVFAKTTSEMQTQSTYTDYSWSFGTPANPSTWKMPISGYPQLEWQNNRVDMEEFVRLAQYWQMTGCDNSQPCAAADWYVDEVIDINDLMQLGKSWLAAEMQIYREQPPQIFDGFETGDFNTLNWVHSGGFVNWSIASDQVHEGSYAAKSGTITDGQTSTIQLTIDTTGFDTISFARKVSSEANYDFLYFYIDLVETASFSGEQDWQVVEYPITDGLHTFIWEYYKDFVWDEGQDCAWIDTVRIYNSNP